MQHSTRKENEWGRSDLNTQPLGISNHAPELSHPPKGQHTQSCFWSPTSCLIRLRPQTAYQIHTTDIKPLCDLRFALRTEQTHKSKRYADRAQESEITEKVKDRLQF